MNALENLLEEHRIIGMMIGILGDESKKLQSGKELSQETFEKILDIMMNFTDKCHHGKEEDALFPLIKKRDVNEASTIARFLEEHERGRNFTKALGEAVTKNSIDDVIKNASGYISILPLHIRKENMIFPKWINALSDETKEGLKKEFEEIEERSIGLGKRQEYAKAVEKLKGL